MTVYMLADESMKLSRGQRGSKGFEIRAFNIKSKTIIK